MTRISWIFPTEIEKYTFVCCFFYANNYSTSLGPKNFSISRQPHLTFTHAQDRLYSNDDLCICDIL